MELPISLPTLGVILLGLTVVLYGLRLLMLPKPLPGIPHNAISATRLMGDAPDFFEYQKKHGDLFTYFSELALKLNSPIFQVFLRPFDNPWVVVMDSRESYDIMTRRVKDFDRSNFMGENFAAVTPEFHVHFPTNEKWHEHRRLMGETMSPAFLRDVAGPQMWGTTQRLVELWREKAKLAQGRPWQAQGDLHKGALDITWAATFGKAIGSNVAQTAYLQKREDEIKRGKADELVVFPTSKDPEAFTSILTLTESMDIPMQSLFPRQHHWLALRLFPRLAAARRHKDRMIVGSLEEAKNRFSSKSVQDLESLSGLRSALDLVVTKEMRAASKQNRPPRISSHDIQDELFGFLIGGHETTSTTLGWGIKYLTNYQTAQTKLRDALRASFSDAYRESRQPSVAEISTIHVPYLEAVMEEANRCGLTSPGKVRRTLVDTDVLGYHVPKGIDVFMMNNGPGYLSPPLPIAEAKRSKSSQDAKGRTPEWVSDDLAEFKPERWLLQDAQGIVTFNANAGPNMPFGAGPRACFGKKWALMELKIVLVLLTWNFDFLPLPAELADLRAIDGVTRRPENVYVRVRALT